MAENKITQAIYQLKNEFVSHTGPLGRQVEKLVAEKWVRDIEAAIDSVDAEVEDYPEAANGSSQEVFSGHCVESAPEAFSEYRRRLKEKRFPSVAMAVHSLAIGGGEIFPIHLANCLWDMGVPVILISCGMRPEDPKTRGLIEAELPVLTLDSFTQLPWAIDHYRCDVVHSHHAMIDLAVSEAIRTGKIKARQVITLHGMYEALDAPRRKMAAERVAETSSCFAYIADKNLQPFQEAGAGIDSRFAKLPNGLPEGYGHAVSRSSLGIEKEAFVLCLVSRALWTKGWKEAIDSVKMANEFTGTYEIPGTSAKLVQDARSIHLILVGDGEAYEKLKKEKDPHIHFVGAQQDTRQYLAASDMGFLPSRYSGESFPLALIDSFMCGKPVIASRMGEIPSMMMTKRGTAGYLFSLTDEGAVPVRRIAGAIYKIASDPDIYRKMCSCAKIAAERYDIRNVAGEYLDLYRHVMDGAADATNTESPEKPDAERAEKPDVKILISCHKPSAALRSDIFQPIQVGAALADRRFEGMLQDDKGDNISHLNRSYCEMTAQYWAWKNLKADYYGFFHYRRYLSLSEKHFREDRYGNVYEPTLSNDPKQQERLAKRYGWTDDHIRSLMRKYDIVTIEDRDADDRDGSVTVRQQYAAAPYLFEKDLNCLMDIIHEKSPDYEKAATAYLDGTRAYYCNMFICRADIFKDYCAWAFPILTEFCRRIDMSGYNTQQLRTPGHLAERMWGIYYSKLKETGKYRTKEMQCVVFSDTENSQGTKDSVILDSVKRTVHAVLSRQRKNSV